MACQAKWCIMSIRRYSFCSKKNKSNYLVTLDFSIHICDLGRISGVGCFPEFNPSKRNSSTCNYCKLRHYTGFCKSNRGPVSTGMVSSVQFHCFRITRTKIWRLLLKISYIVVMPDLHLPLQLPPLKGICCCRKSLKMHKNMPKINARPRNPNPQNYFLATTLHMHDRGRDWRKTELPLATGMGHLLTSSYIMILAIHKVIYRPTN